MGSVLLNYGNLKKQINPASTDANQHGKIIIQVGSATCENAAGAEAVWVEFEKLIKATRRDDIVIKQTGCTGRCSQEPIVGIFVPNHIPVKYQQVTVDKVQTIFQEHVLGNNPVPSLMLDKKTDILTNYVVTICSTEACNGHSKDWKEIFKQKIAAVGLPENTVKTITGGCIGLCGPDDVGECGVMMVFPDNIIYRFRSESDLDEIIESHFILNEVHKKYQTHTEHLTEEYFKLYGDVSFFNKQTRITLRNCGIIDPESISDYIHEMGYLALARMLDKGDRQHVIDEIVKSGLRGRGGGGFPTGQKWKLGAETNPDPLKYVVCNADEGDPGAFMDRSALEGDPYSIVEGMTIGAFAIGASKGFVYCRAEYPLAIKRLNIAIKQARELGLLGENILGSGFSFDLEVRLGAGAFVCGEETALMMSIEGKRGQPKIRPPFPSEHGLWGHPTVINNVETWANVPAILLYGSDWFSRIGTKGSKGTKVFALAGKVNNTGLIEVPMGTTLREIIYDIGGGIPDGRTLKSVQTGGPSGGCIPVELLDTAVDYETLRSVGSMMGSGGMIVLDDRDCMVATAKFFLEFTKDESCGKCLPCREGTFRMLEILERITSGEGKLEDLDKLERLGKMIQKTSLCGLGQSAPNPVLSAIKNFREEFEIHINEKRCPTQKCSKLITYTIIPDKCTGCTLCARRCPAFCIRGFAKKPHEIIQEHCVKCGECYNSCKFDAIIKV